MLDVELKLALELVIELLLLAEKLEFDDLKLTPSDPPPQPVHSNRIASNHIRDRLEFFMIHVIYFHSVLILNWSTGHWITHYYLKVNFLSND